MARCLPSLSLIPEAFARGEMSYSKVRAITRIANPENEAELLDFARHGTTAQVERLVREWRRLDQGVDSQAARAERRGLSLWLADDGSYEVRGRLNPEVGAQLLKALEVAEARLYRAERSAGTEHETSAAQRRADALGLWLEERVQPQVQLVVHSLEGDEHQKQEDQDQEQDAPALLVTEEGSRVSAETSSRLACDAEVVPIARARDGSVLDVGRRRRTVGWRLRKALEARDGGCRFPGCESRVRTHAHHITPWVHGGETAMNNLVLLCPFHHRAVHEGGWRVEMDEWGAPRFFNPLGVPVPVQPAAPDIGGLVPRRDSAAPTKSSWERPRSWSVLPESAPTSSKSSPAIPLASSDPPAASSTPLADRSAPSARDFGLARWHGQDGIDAWTGTTLWQGERLDWGWALACLWREGDHPGGARIPPRAG